MIRITKVEFENYRQYKSVNVSFDDSGEHDLHILKAQNGTGKTTFLNGILWCLYSHEHYLSDKDKALPIVNSSLVQESPEKTSLKVLVRITLSNDGEIIVFERVQMFHVTVNPLSGVKSAVPGSTSLKVIVTPVLVNGNTVVYEDEVEVQSLVKQYFDEAIYDYYFFDGENLKSYFSKRITPSCLGEFRLNSSPACSYTLFSNTLIFSAKAVPYCFSSSFSTFTPSFSME